MPLDRAPDDPGLPHRPTIEIEILYPEPDTLHQPQSGAVQQAAGEPMMAVQFPEHLLDLRLGQDHRKSLRLLGANGPYDLTQGLLQDHLVGEHQGVEGLILGARGDIPIHREVGEEGADLGLAHVPRMTLVVKQDKAPGPVQIGLLGPDAVVAGANRITHLFQER